MNKKFNFVIVGGGIAGVTCAETLAILSNEASILIITKTQIIKFVSRAISITKTLTALDIEEIEGEKLVKKYPNINIIKDNVKKLNPLEKSVQTENNLLIFFDKLCICTGGTPKLLNNSNPYVIGIRDTESVAEFEKRISSARKLMIVGNGGIASEIVYEVQGVDKIWVIKDNYFSKTFIDPGAAEFFQGNLQKNENSSGTIVKKVKCTASNSPLFSSSTSPFNSPALGPDWHKNFNFRGTSNRTKIEFEFNAEVEKIISGDEFWPVYVELTNKKIHGVDLIVSATGVNPNSEVFAFGNDLKIAEDGGIIVDWKMETSLKDIYAAGDVSSAGWEWAPHWHQMRLWTQARQMGSYAAKCMIASYNNEMILQDFSFEIFSHVTKLYGFKVVLLGLFNGQKLENEYELLIRMTKGKEYVKLVIKNGKLQGALLIGETDLEEMCENLILNQLDISAFGEDLLNPDIDIEDYFD